MRTAVQSSMSKARDDQVRRRQRPRKFIMPFINLKLIEGVFSSE
jgi:hypothetical protein